MPCPETVQQAAPLRLHHPESTTPIIRDCFAASRHDTAFRIVTHPSGARNDTYTNGSRLLSLFLGMSKTHDSGAQGRARVNLLSPQGALNEGCPAYRCGALCPSTPQKEDDHANECPGSEGADDRLFPCRRHTPADQFVRHPRPPSPMTPTPPQVLPPPTSAGSRHSAPVRRPRPSSSSISPHSPAAPRPVPPGATSRRPARHSSSTR